MKILVERDGDLWIATAVDYDLVCSAMSLGDIHDEVQLMLMAHERSRKELGTEPWQEKTADVSGARERFAKARVTLLSQASQLPSIMSFFLLYVRISA
jgi:hypothetical protein